MSPREFHPPEPTGVPQGVPIAPPPWPLKVKLWTFLYSSPSPSHATTNTAANPNNAPEILQGAPPGSYNPLEVINPRALEPLSDGSDAGRFQLQEGGMDLRGVVLVRYEDTPAGPYDELLLIPGTYTAPGKKSRDKKAQRVTNIYVSTDASVWNGRWNWNIAKHRADFSFEPIDARRTRVRVSHPADSPLHAGGAPFFSAILTSSRIPSIPLPSLSPFSIIQPPLERPRQGALEAVIATSTAGHPWLKISPTYKGKWGISWIGREEGKEVYGDGVSFPALEGMWALGSVFEGEIAFPFATVVDVS